MPVMIINIGKYLLIYQQIYAELAFFFFGEV